MKLVYILFANSKSWFRYGRKPHYEELSKFGKLLVVEEPLKLFSKEFFKNPLKVLRNYFKYSSGLRNDTKYNIVIIRPILLFSSKLKNKSNFLKTIDLLLLNFQMKKFNIKSESKILLLTNRFQKWIIKKNESTKYILDIDDEWSMILYDDKQQKYIEKDLRILIDEVSLSTTVTIELQRKYSYKNKVVFLPNGVDTSHYVPKFEKNIEKKIEMKIDELNLDKKFLEETKNDPKQYLTNLEILKTLKAPFIGSISGMAGNWSDFDFMRKVEKLLPDKFTMVSSGNIHPPTHPNFQDEYRKYILEPRMIYLGFLDYAVLPDFLEYLSVGIVMHRMDSFNVHSAPNKIWAYLAMGMPVVCTNFLNDYDKEIYEGEVKFARSPDEYVEFIVNEYKTDNLNKKIIRRNLAIKYSTENRAKRLSELIIDKTLKI